MKPPEQNKRRILAEWLGKANTDLDLAVHLVDEGAIFPNAIAFNSQQAAEKYIKAYLAWHEVDFPKTHDLERLLDLVEPVDANLATSLRDAIVLTPYGAELRYPGDRPDASPTEAREAVELARKVRDTILPLLPELPDA
jgi:HEPN domain-containing protein